MILLDTSAAIFIMRGQMPDGSLCDETLGLSTVAQMELLHGALHGGKAKELAKVQSFCGDVEIFDYGSDAALSTARVMAGLWKLGKPIGDIDSQIAGHAISLGLPLLTDNTKHFLRVEGLEVLSWSKG